MRKMFCFKSVLLGTLLVMCISGCGKSTAAYIESEDAISTEEVVKTTEITTEMKETSTFFYVYVCGEVEMPGVYTMPEGSRVCDVFAEAGGLTEDAAEDYWNQARLLTDGEMIYVPTKEEASERTLTLSDASSTSQNTDDSTDGKVNINTASKEELMTIPGIGEAKALAILSYRQEHGTFSAIEEVKNVEGIKDGVYTKMKDYIVIN